VSTSPDVSFLSHRAASYSRHDPKVPRRLLTRESAHALATFVQQQTRTERYVLPVVIRHAITSVATQRVGFDPQASDVDELLVSWPTMLGSSISVTIDTNVRDVATLQRVIDRASVAKTPPPKHMAMDDGDDDPSLDRPRTYLPVALYHDATIEGMAYGRGAALTRLLEPFHGTDWHGMGTVALCGQSCYMLGEDPTRGLFAESTDCEVSMSARSADGSAVGWAGRTHRDWQRLDPAEVAREAIATAEQHRNPSRVEPGRYTAILSPTAVGQLLRTMASGYDIMSDSPFDLPGHNRPGGPDRRGQRVFDARITLSTDPTDPEAGEFPFMDDGTPNPKSVWVENGVLKTRAASYLPAALDYGFTPRDVPTGVRMSGGTTSIADMIAQCKRGIYVNRFADLRVVHPHSGALSGFTRDGCLLILNGKISRPVTNFRIFESPFLSFNRVLAIGPARRVAFGFTPPQSTDYHEHWPLKPVIAPSLMVQDFNFEALSDAT